MSLTTPHPIWSSLDGNPYEAKAAKIQAVFLTGRYRTARLCRFWSENNREGYCLLDSCKDRLITEDLDHIILYCPSLSETRRRLFRFTSDYVAAQPILSDIIRAYLYATDTKVVMQFIIDCSVLPLVISAHQTHGQATHNYLYKIMCTWCRSLHRDRLRALGRYVNA